MKNYIADDGLVAKRSQAAADEHSAVPGGEGGAAQGGQARAAPHRLGGRGHRPRRGHRGQAEVDDNPAHNCSRGNTGCPMTARSRNLLQTYCKC